MLQISTIRNSMGINWRFSKKVCRMFYKKSLITLEEGKTFSFFSFLHPWEAFSHHHYKHPTESAQIISILWQKILIKLYNGMLVSWGWSFSCAGVAIYTGEAVDIPIQLKLTWTAVIFLTANEEWWRRSLQIFTRIPIILNFKKVAHKDKKFGVRLYSKLWTANIMK